MKTLFVSFVALLFAFFVECQENSITDPATDNSISGMEAYTAANVDKNVISYFPELIKLNGLLWDPSHPYIKNLAKIEGSVRYQLKKVQFDQRPPDNGIKVSLLVKALIKGGCPGSRVWGVNKSLEVIVKWADPDKAVQYFEKSFKVCNTCCHPLKLVV